MELLFSCSSTHWGISYPWLSFIAIFSIGLVTILAVSLAVSIANKRSFLSSFKLHPEEGLSKQGMFWIAIFLPFSMFLITGIFAWWGCEFSLSSQGYINFFIISKLPLGLLALAFPFGLMVTRIHGTEQTALQINKVNTQLSNAEKFEETRLKEKNATELKLYIERHVDKSIQAIEKIKLIINEETNGVLLLIKKNIEISEDEINLNLDFPKQHLTDMLNIHNAKIFNLDVTSLVIDIINVAKLLQAAASLRNDLVRHLSSNESLGNHGRSEHLWLVNAIWLEFSKVSDVVNTLVTKTLKYCQTNNNGIKEYPDLSEKQVMELLIYQSTYETWQSDDGRTYFGFSV